eukprot:TRINITY_DN4273_c0_g1_i7.p1 TRINITY_DN4273_c0_g1~~TRINITY_DN4273_c0_g1_i7.p1  ORF type:complete len:562 (-),score=161.91 TRINITY_DN4273_c0_g1_i7:856-2541(-)
MSFKSDEERQALLKSHTEQLQQVQERWKKKVEELEEEHESKMAAFKDALQQQLIAKENEMSHSLEDERKKFQQSLQEINSIKDKSITRLQQALEEERQKAKGATSANSLHMTRLEKENYILRKGLAVYRQSFHQFRTDYGEMAYSTQSRIREFSILLQSFENSASPIISRSLGLLKEIQDYKTTLEGSSKKLQMLQSELIDEKARNETISEELSIAKSRNNQLQVEIKSFIEDRVLLMSKIQNLEHDIQEHLETISKLRESSTLDKEKELGSLRQKSEAQINDFKRQIEMLQMALKDKDLIEESMKQQLTARLASLDKVTSEKNILESSVKLREKEIHTLRGTIFELESDIKTLKETRDMFREGSKNAKDREDQTQSLMSELKKSYDDALTELAKLRAEREERAESHKKQLQDLQELSAAKIVNMKKMYEDQIQGLQSQFDSGAQNSQWETEKKLVTLREKYEAQLRKLEADYLSKSKEASMTSKLQEQLNQNQDQLKVAQAERESLRTKNDQLNKQLTELKQKIAQQEQEMNVNTTKIWQRSDSLNTSLANLHSSVRIDL